MATVPTVRQITGQTPLKLHALMIKVPVLLLRFWIQKDTVLIAPTFTEVMPLRLLASMIKILVLTHKSLQVMVTAQIVQIILDPIETKPLVSTT